MFRPRIFFFFLLLIGLSSNHKLYSQKIDLIFFDSDSNKRLKIDLRTRQLFIENSSNVWKLKGQLNFENVYTEDILPVYKINAFKSKSNYYLTIPGTGHVYYLIENKLLLKRIDKSFHTGYNFQAVQFFRKDTLFSFGGYGFWQYHNILTYFDHKSSEWETYCQLEVGPSRFTNRFSTYLPKSDKVLALELPKPYLFNKTKKYNYWEFNFKSKSWKKKGVINDQLALALPESKPAGQYFFFKYQNQNYVADPENNKVYLYDGPHTKLADSFDPEPLFSSKNHIYSYQNYLVGNVRKYTTDSISIQHLLSSSKFQFELINDNTFEYSLYLILFISFIPASFYLFRIFSKKNLILSNSNEIFTSFEYEILRKMISKGELYEFSTDELNVYLDAERKPLETQRQIRSRFINSINQKSEIHFQISNGISRRKSRIDKRFSIYILDLTFIKELNKL